MVALEGVMANVDRLGQIVKKQRSNTASGIRTPYVSNRLISLLKSTLNIFPELLKMNLLRRGASAAMTQSNGRSA